MIKYYQQQGCRENAAVTARNYQIQFTPCAFFAGNWWGVYATEQGDEIDSLDSIVGTQGVSEITREEFEGWAKKKGTRQTHTWVVTESVLDHRPAPSTPPSEEKSAASATAEVKDEPAQDHPIDELLQTAPRDDSTPIKDVVTNQTALADVLGISTSKLRTLSRTEGNPGRTNEGYQVSDWESFLNKQG